ncbi:hypothetical protein NPX13_g5335 [Xylaria arbuscula]|uniref:DUF676 domain-containing protein n=1 Tax=Xylaria arbuscula TaxID=114810 RepID=A0A9W8NE72_9PEZI|nr:hypothetical protein NPX13_g5335 [Xylaria arbuscula]
MLGISGGVDSLFDKPQPVSWFVSLASTTAVVKAAPNTNWLQIISDPQNANLDIVAVHGMNVGGSDDHSENAWTEEQSGTHWLRDLLPEKLPRAIILAYQYNANVILKTSVAGVAEQAQNLLHCLFLERTERKEVRPIIFIAHSMGGILVKEALATSFHDSLCYRMIWVFTYGVVFFGVPHKGSKHVTWGKMAARMVRIFTGQPNESFLGSVEEGSNYNVQLSKRFSPLLDAFKFFSICETLPERVGISVRLIVEPDSAILGLPDSQEVKLYPNRTHRTICKFAHNSDPEWKQISSTLVHGAACAISYTGYSPTMTVREMPAVHSNSRSTFDSDIDMSLDSVQRAIDQAQLILASSAALFNNLEDEEKFLNKGILESISWVLPIIAALGILSRAYVPFWYTLVALAFRFSSLADNFMENAEGIRQSQKRLIDFQGEAIDRIDSHRSNVLKAIVELRPPFLHEQLSPNHQLLIVELEDKLSQQLALSIRDL